MPVKNIEVHGIGAVRFQKHRLSKAIRVTVTKDNKVKVTLPFWVPYAAAVSFTQSKREWIQKHVKDTRFLSEDDRVGKAHRLRFEAIETTTKPISRVANGEITISYAASDRITSEKVQTKAVEASERALKKEAENLLPQRLAQLAEKYGFEYSEVRVRKLSSRWGSCSSRGLITLNYYLMNLPWSLIDYVLIHELAHTKHHNHGKDFWAATTECMPSAKQLRKELKQYSPSFA